MWALVPLFTGALTSKDPNGCVTFPPHDMVSGQWVTDEWLESVGPIEAAQLDSESVPIAAQHVSTAVLAAEPQPFSTAQPRLIALDSSVADSLGINSSWLESNVTAIDVFSDRARFCGTTAFYHNYGGHQFGTWAGQLGDGRAVSLGIRQSTKTGGDASREPPLEVAIKGGGRTPFSRRGDGRAVLQSNCREFLASRALFALGVPTTRALCVVATDIEFDGLMRDVEYQGHAERVAAGTLTRVSPSFVRFGSVQIVARRQGPEGLARLARATLRQIHRMEVTGDPATAGWSFRSRADVQSVCFFTPATPSCAAQADSLTDAQVLKCLLSRVSVRTAALIAAWMAVGFAHGVMNTDNLSLLGITIDLNVFGFINEYDLTFAPNLIDEESRYAFGRQKEIGWWNLLRVRDAITGMHFVNDYTENKATWNFGWDRPFLNKSVGNAAIENYNATFETCYHARMRLRLGLQTRYDSAITERKAAWLVRAWLRWLLVAFPDYHYTSRALGDVLSLYYPMDLGVDYSSDVDMLLDTARHKSMKARRWARNLLRVLHTVVHRTAPPSCLRLAARSERIACTVTKWQRSIRVIVPKRVLRTAQTKIITEQTAVHGRSEFVTAAFGAISRPFDFDSKHGRGVRSPLLYTTDLPPLPRTGPMNAISTWVGKALSAVPDRDTNRMKTSCGGQ